MLPNRYAYVDEQLNDEAGSQPHGILVIVAVESLLIESISANVAELLGRAPLELCGAPIGVLFSPADGLAFSTMLRDPQRAARHHAPDVRLTGARGSIAVECGIHRIDNRWFIEFEPRGPQSALPLNGEMLDPIERLRTAPDVETLLAGAARDIAAISGFDVVSIVQYDSRHRRSIVAQTPSAGIDPAFAAPQLSEAQWRMLVCSPLQLVADRHAVPAPLVSAEPQAPDAAGRLPASLHGAAPEYLDWLARAGSRSGMTVSIIIRGRLWGLIACRNAEPRRVDHGRRAACELMADLLAWQLDSRTIARDPSERDRAAALQASIAATIDTTPEIGAAVIEAMPHLVKLFRASGIVVRTQSKLVRSGGVADDALVFAVAAQLNTRADTGIAFAHHPADLGVRQPALPESTAALLIRITADGSDFILLFRFAPARAQRHDRLSFAIVPPPQAWTSEDISAARAVRSYLSLRRPRAAAPRTESTSHVDRYLELRNAQAAALRNLQDDLAVALPSRPAIINAVLRFAQRQTEAGGSVMENVTDEGIVYEAATGMLAQFAGMSASRAGSRSGMSADLHAPLLCEDASRDLERSERETCERMGIASMVVVPVTVSETVTIVIKVVSSERGAFDDEDVQTLKIAATNLLTALRAAQEFAALAAAEKEQRTYARRLRALHAIASTTTSNRKDQIDAALELGLEQLGLDWAFLGVIDYAANDFVIENSVSRNGSSIVEAGLRTPLGQTIVGRVAHSKGVRIVADVSKLAESPAYGGWASYIAVPLFIGGVNYGAIGFTSREVHPHPFSEANIEFVAVAGELIASAVERGLQREQLETSETRYRALTEAIPELVWVIDASNTFEFVNARWTNYTGLTLEQSRTTGPAAIYDVAQFASGNGTPSTTSPTEHDGEVRLRRYDGTYRWHLMRSVPFRDAAGDAGKWLVTATDIEERKSAETIMAGVHEAALAATQAKSRFLATMSHEIRTPMNAVIGMTELLLLTQLNDEQREYIEIVRDSGKSLLRVLNDILDYSKIEAGKLELESVHFDLPSQVESVVELLRAQYHLKGVVLTTRVDSDVPAVVDGDPGRLRQILLNLTGNALKFTPAGGEVHIRVSVAPSENNQTVPIRFTIQDTGIGMPPEVVSRLFQPFSQGDESTTRKYGGTGLGLSICAQLVALMGGTIGVESVPESGSAFWFVVPLQPAKPVVKALDAPKRGPAVRAKPVIMRAEKILLVEDNEINTFLALKQLQRIGFIVSAVNNGQQAVDAVMRERFDLVFMDCHMPEMDGFAATREIRRLELGTQRRLPIVAMTADARTEDQHNCLLVGMDDYISKPTSLESLRTVLDRWLPTADRRQNNRNGAAAAAPPAMGVANLLELFGGDRATVITLLSAAAGSIKADFGRIENCAATRDYTAVAEAAHRLTGTSGSIRSPRLGAISAAVERAACSVEGDIPAALLGELRAAVDTLLADVEKHIKLLATLS